MKKIFLAVSAIVLAWTAGAQTFDSDPVRVRPAAQFGILAGVTSTATDIQSAWAEAEEITQYHVGIGGKFNLGDIFVFQPMLIYNIKGSKISEQEAGTDFKADFKTGFIELPLQFQLGFPLGADFRIFALAEPFVGYGITNESKEELGDIKETKHNWDSVKNRLEYGGSLGAGLELAGGLQLQVKYFWNFGNIYKDSEHPDNNNGGGNAWDKVKHSNCSGIMATLGFFF